jgi:catechol 2,3-dioxygenase-like lactoylglutathione lyase family enzyme
MFEDTMLKSNLLKGKSSSAIVAVNDLDRARDFYENKLGLQRERAEEKDVLSFKTGDTWLTVYQSKNYRPSTGNAIAWSGGNDVEAIAEQLRAKGVKLEEYPDLGLRIENGVHKADGFAGIWFKDPDGNILHVNSM